MSKKRSYRRSTTSRKFDIKAMASEAKKPLLILGGMWAGSQVAKMLDKSVTPAVSGVFGLDAVEGKRMVTPVLLIGAGLAASQMSGNSDVKMVSYGVAAAGGAVLVKNMLKTDVVPISGIGSHDLRRSLPGIGEVQLDELPITGEDEKPIAGEDEKPIAGDGSDEEPIA